MEISNNISNFQMLLPRFETEKSQTEIIQNDNKIPNNDFNSSNNMKTEIYKDTGDTVYKTFRNKKLLFQFPTSDILKLRAYIQNNY